MRSYAEMSEQEFAETIQAAERLKRLAELDRKITAGEKAEDVHSLAGYEELVRKQEAIYQERQTLAEGTKLNRWSKFLEEKKASLRDGHGITTDKRTEREMKRLLVQRGESFKASERKRIEKIVQANRVPCVEWRKSRDRPISGSSVSAADIKRVRNGRESTWYAKPLEGLSDDQIFQMYKESYVREV